VLFCPDLVEIKFSIIQTTQNTHFWCVAGIPGPRLPAFSLADAVAHFPWPMSAFDDQGLLKAPELILSCADRPSEVRGRLPPPPHWNRAVHSKKKVAWSNNIKTDSSPADASEKTTRLRSKRPRSKLAAHATRTAVSAAKNT